MSFKLTGNQLASGVQEVLGFHFLMTSDLLHCADFSIVDRMMLLIKCITSDIDALG